ncbi:2,4-dienoyl-CoA reductase [Amycolatopsis arida]|uniref:2,4-dienoyl-CoA reductase n=1 Tax=Amycolatopsis arida TaxID=587909 RepID=A0A1I5Z082_9PSEU|nr:NADH:flavin oxidoreductase [Amycolatopsis arida]TDX90018.1 2,4-dienoyl-CoA reductase-like NADH-dependent reductase (Old Yellow Enzyme family) [Amycolatopsis arida]SFQ49886.1 2,4-dienoyl-CoA reductase [Amycolatopsis arida]
MATHPALTPVRLGRLDLPNRAVVAPMSRVSTRGDGVPTPAMARYYARYAAGGFGLVVTEGTYPDDRYSQSYPNQPGIVTPAQVAAWRAVVDAVHAAGGRIALQLMHAGALVQHDRFRPIAPSAIPPKGARMPAYGGGDGPFPLPRAASRDDILAAVEGFAAAAARARDAGFDAVEIHGANGYLIDQFLTTYTNLRDDEYGGDVAGRARLAVGVVRAVRAAVGPDFPVGIRLSQTKVNDVDYRWPGGTAEAETIVRMVAGAGVDVLHLASEGRDWVDGATLDTGVTVTRLARAVTGLPVIANGGLHDVWLSRSVLADGHADLVALGRGALVNPDWPRRVAEGAELAAFDAALLRPDATLTSQAAWERARAAPAA